MPGTAEKIHSRAGFVAYIGIPARIPSVPSDRTWSCSTWSWVALLGEQRLVPSYWFLMLLASVSLRFHKKSLQYNAFRRKYLSYVVRNSMFKDKIHEELWRS